MVALPIPILTFVLSAIACGLIWRLELGNRLARGFFTVAFALVTLASLLVGLRFGYGLEQFIVIQRIIPLFIGPLIYLGFLAFARAPEDMRILARYHLGIAAALAALPQVLPVFRAGFDVLIGLSYLFYSLSLLMLWRKGADALGYAPLALAAALRLWMLYAAGTLCTMLAFDTSIAISFAMQRFDDAIRLISLGSFVSMVGILFAIIVFSKGTRKATTTPNPAKPLDTDGARLERSARDLLNDTELYLDTDLTLERLAKRLHVPARALSAAINQTQGVNVSQYVNGFRLKHAATLLENSDLSVKRVMEASGFLTRSNFYREFERVYARSPIEYRKHIRATGSERHGG